MSSFEYGDVVQKKKGYKFPGVVVAVYYTLKGEIRYVVECTAKGAEGCQHIFNGEQLELYNIKDNTKYLKKAIRYLNANQQK